MMVRRFQCLLLCHVYRIMINVFATSEAEVEAIAKQKAANNLKRLYGLPVGVTDMNMVSCRDLGTDPAYVADSQAEQLLVVGG